MPPWAGATCAACATSRAGRAQQRSAARPRQRCSVAGQDAETGQRGYVITGSSEYLAPYSRRAARRSTRSSDELERLTGDDPAQSAGCAEVRTLASDAKLERARADVGLRQAQRLRGHPRGDRCSGAGKARDGGAARYRGREAALEAAARCDARERQSPSGPTGSPRYRRWCRRLAALAAAVGACCWCCAATCATGRGGDGRARRAGPSCCKITLASIGDGGDHDRHRRPGRRT